MNNNSGNTFTNNNFYNNINENAELLQPWGYNLVALILFLIGFFGFTLNLFVIIFMCKNVHLWNPMNIILFNLVCSDFLVSIFGNPFTLTAALSHKWIFGTELCIAYGFLMALLGITSITTLTVLAYERYCLVKYPLSLRKIKNHGAVIFVILIWSYSLLLTTPPLFGWGAYVNEAAGISCSVNWETKSLNATTYIVFLFIFGLIVPVIVISYSYTNIIITLRKNSSRLGRKSRGEKHITCMVAIMIFTFMIAWTPYATFALIEQFGPSDFITPQVAVIPALVAKSSICYNPVIYVGMNTQFRASWKRFLTKDSTATDTITNKISQTNESMVTVDHAQTKQYKKDNIFLKTYQISLFNCSAKVDMENNDKNTLNNSKVRVNYKDSKQILASPYKSEQNINYKLQLLDTDIDAHVFKNSNNSIKRSISLGSIAPKFKNVNIREGTVVHAFTKNDDERNKINAINSSGISQIVTHDTTVFTDGKQIKTVLETDSFL